MAGFCGRGAHQFDRGLRAGRRPSRYSPANAGHLYRERLQDHVKQLETWRRLAYPGRLGEGQA
eukprot:1743100-Alexandrium_andersonii.AAC.1